MHSRRARQPKARKNVQWGTAYVTELVTGYLTAASLGGKFVKSRVTAWTKRHNWHLC